MDSLLWMWLSVRSSWKTNQPSFRCIPFQKTETKTSFIIFLMWCFPVASYANKKKTIHYFPEWSLYFWQILYLTTQMLCIQSIHSLRLTAIKELFNYFSIAEKLNEVCTAQAIWLSYCKTQGGSWLSSTYYNEFLSLC